MFKKWILLLVLIYLYNGKCADPEIEEEEIRARAYLIHLDKKTSERENKVIQVNWEYASNITNQNLMTKLLIAEAALKETKEDWEETMKFNWQSYRDPDIKRQFKKYVQLDEEALPEEKYRKLLRIITDMQQIFSTAKVKDYSNQTDCPLLGIEPELMKVMATTTDPEELKYYWIEWHKAVGSPGVKKLYQEYVRYINEAAQINNCQDAGQMWLSDYETDGIQNDFKRLWEQIRPLYMQLHAYVRFKLKEKYGDIVSEKGPIPVHLLGNMWGQNWKSVLNYTIPFPKRKPSDITFQLERLHYTPIKIVKTAEDFFVSLNLSAMPESFWNKSIFLKPTDRKMICHASAWDFFDGEDFRIKMCARVDEETLIVVHHEMGHIQYYMQYKNLPNIYRTGANSGFHEAVGDTISLSVGTLKHLKKIGLSKTEVIHEQDLLNNLYRVGLTKIAALPFGYLVDLWRWDVFSGKIKPDEYNCKWWQLRNEIQGVESPVDRNENDFDPVAKYHIAASVPYIRYFASYILQFQFHKALCEIAGEYVAGDPTKPLHECDIYGSTEAGNAFSAMMRLGSSKPWQDALEGLTKQRNMDASGLMEYFDPLLKWLIGENRKNNAYIGWDNPTKVCRNEEPKDLDTESVVENEPAEG